MSDEQDPFHIEGPASVSFSGGRTSGYLLRRILNANPSMDNVVVLFMNTGKERKETLDFVHRVSVEWGVHIHWLEWINDDPKYRVVSYETASRNGEPFEQLISRRGYPPNPVTRYCTQELKINAMRRFCVDYMKWDRWTNVVGIRADERHRYDRMLARKDRWQVTCPLVHAGVTQNDVLKFWSECSFDLGLRPHEGNCDLCFLKGAGKIETIIREHPHMADWWAEQEERIGKPFRIDRASYRSIQNQLSIQLEMFPGQMSNSYDRWDEGDAPCGVCGD